MSKPASHRDDALRVLHRLRQAGHEAYFAGGCVRDLLLSREPADYDIATSATPDAVRSLFRSTQAVGAAFGVILVREASSVIEVATFRTDLDYQDGRRAQQVRFSTAAEDAGRRDFTINGLFLDPIDQRVIDFVGGQADLAAGVIRAIGQPTERFAEDHLRVLRAIRFAARFDFPIEPATATAMTANVPKLIRISPERTAEELRLMLSPPTRPRAVALLEQFEIVQILLRFLPDASAAAAAREPIGLLQKIDSPSVGLGLALAAIGLEFRHRVQAVGQMADLLQPQRVRELTASLRKSLKISNAESDQLSGSLDVQRLLTAAEPTLASRKRFLMQPHATEAMLLLRSLNAAGFFRDRLAGLLPDLKQLRQTDFAPPPLINGDDLTTAGASPGPRFKLALDAAYDAQLEHRISTVAEAMTVAQNILHG